MAEESPSMDKEASELLCVGRLEILRPKALGFRCGSFCVPTERVCVHSFNSAPVPSSQISLRSPHYKQLPPNTDLNTLPVLPTGAEQSKAAGESPWPGLVEYGNKIDVIAPAQILKQIFKIPYSNCRLSSIAVCRVGKTLVLNSGPDIEEGDQIVRRHADHALLLKFAMHSACETSAEGQSITGSTSETVGRFGRDLFWQFHDFHMLLRSDMLIFTNEKDAAVSLRLCDKTRKVSPLTWLDAWLDNVMANVPELAICYHQNGVVSHYFLLQTDEILKAASSEDGIPAINPHVIQQNDLSVLRFLQENCMQDPGAYWLYKSNGDNVLQLFDLSSIPKNCSHDGEDSSGSLDSLVHRSRKIDDELWWELVRLLGESYLALGQAYEEGNQLHQALKVVELACSLYGSMPTHFKDARDVGDATNTSISRDDSFDAHQFVPTDLFWVKAWTLVGDVHLKFNDAKNKVQSGVVEEVESLKKKLSDSTQNCTSCSLANCSCQSDGGNSANSNGDSELPAECSTKQNQGLKKGGIFQYLQDPDVKDMEGCLSAALSCYDEARKSLDSNLGGSPELEFSYKPELESLYKKIAAVYVELGYYKIEREQLIEAEYAFVNAISAFREVSDYPNIVRLYLQLGNMRYHSGAKMQSFYLDQKAHGSMYWKQYLERTISDFRESIRYSSESKAELDMVTEEDESVQSSLRDAVYVSYAGIYLTFGIILSREDITAKVYALDSREEDRKVEVTADGAIRIAMSTFESMGDPGKEKAAFAHRQLACCQRDSCLKFLKIHGSMTSNWHRDFLQVKQYITLAEMHWQKAIDGCGPTIDSTLYFSILIEKSAFLLKLSSFLQPQMKYLKSALNCMLEGRHVASSSHRTGFDETRSEFWSQLQLLLKTLVGHARQNKPGRMLQPPATTNEQPRDVEKLSKLYEMSLRYNEMEKLEDMHVLWTS